MTQWNERVARRWEIAENLHRAELTDLQRKEQVAEWIGLVEAEAVVEAQKLGQLDRVSKGGRGKTGGISEGRIGRLPANYAIPESARRTLRQNQLIAERERATAAALAVQPKVQAGFKPPTGKLWGVNVDALLIVGPAGAIGTTAAIIRVLAPLAAGGRHDEAVIAAATGCRDVAALRERLAGISGKLAAIGLRVDRRKAGIRVAKVR